MYFGVQYYPEQWPEDRWSLDAEWMAAAGVNTVRMGEFAWSAYEPRTGEIDFAWMDRALAVLADHGIKTIMCTCSRTPPPWVYATHPDISNTDVNGRRQRAGTRYSYCPSSEPFAEIAVGIDRVVVEHFAGHSAIVGWQIDNEVGGHNDCYCDVCHDAFQRHLAETYGSVAELNKRWGAEFWSFAIQSWDDIPMVGPDRTNPQLALAYRRFQSHLNCEFTRVRADMIREIDPGKWITTNFQSGRVSHTDYHAMSEYLDYNGMNYYPFRSPELVLDYYRGDRGKMLSLEQFTRLEPVDSGPGRMRLWAWQALAHGATGINFFRWRVSRHGQEMHCDGILPQAGQKARRYEELARMGNELAPVSQWLDSSRPQSEVAIVYGYDTRWALGYSKIEGIDLYDEAVRFHEALGERNISVDALDPRRDLAGYKLVIAPRLFLVDPATTEALTRFVRGGGTLCLTAASGVVDEWGRCFDTPRPGPLAELAGITVSDLSALPQPVAIRGVLAGLEGAIGEGRSCADEIHPTTATVVGEFASGWRDGQAAITSNRFGDGRVIYVGAAPSEKTVSQLTDWLCAQTRVEPVIETPSGVRAYRKVGDGFELLFLLNHAPDAREVRLGSEWEDLCEKTAVSRVTVAGVDIKLLKRVE